jgi:signal transduction histidine kinase
MKPPVADKVQQEIDAVQAIAAVPAILDVVCRVTGMGFAAVVRVTDERWIACSVKDDIAFGLGMGDELPLETTLCDEIRRSGEPVIIDDVAESAAYRHHRTPQLYGFQSYISMPIVRSDGSFFGTLCAIDPRPAQVSRPEVVTMFRLFGDLIAFHLDAAERIAQGNAALADAAERIAVGDAALADANHDARLREQFIAVLGHDLRNPLAAVDSGLSMIERSGELGERSLKIVAMMRESTSRGIALIGDVLDFARGRLGGGIAVERNAVVDLGELLREAVAEASAISPGVTIETAIALPGRFACDRSRVLQMISNLIGNAVSHGRTDVPIRLSAREDGGDAVIEIANAGEPIPRSAFGQLFEPFFRNVAGGGREGLGLGLYIADQIARAHGGRIDVRSDASETRFSVRLKAQSAELAEANGVP